MHREVGRAVNEAQCILCESRTGRAQYFSLHSDSAPGFPVPAAAARLPCAIGPYPSLTRRQ